MDLKESVLWTETTTSSDTSMLLVLKHLSTIRENTRPAPCKYVNTASYPADHASRGLNAEHFIKCQNWIEGPDFLAKSESHWPVLSEFSREISEDDADVKRTTSVNIIKTVDSSTYPPPSN